MKAALFPSQKVQLDLVTTQGKKPTRYHNILNIIFSVVVLTLSIFYFGYNLVHISCVPMNVLVSAFSTKISNAAALGFLICLITIGCLSGVIISSYFVDKISRKKLLLIVNVLALITGGVVQIPDIYALGTARLFEGIVSGCYMNLIPAYIAEITPHEIGWMFTHWGQTMCVLGVDIAYMFQLIFTAGNLSNQAYWRAIFIIPVGIVLLQSILLIFIPDSPFMLLKENKIDKARQIYSKFYKEEYIDEAIKERVEEMYRNSIIMMSDDQYKEYKKGLTILTELRQTKRNTINGNQANQIQKQTQRQQLAKLPDNSFEKSFEKSFPKSLPISIGKNSQQQPLFPNTVQNQEQIAYLDSLRNKYTPEKTILGFLIAQAFHMTGILAVITQAGEVLHDFNSHIGQITPVTITTVQLVFTITSIFVIRGMGTYMNIIVALALMGINHIINGILFIFINWQPATSICLAILMFNMIVFGSSLGNSVGMATAELVHPKLLPYSSTASWTGASFCILFMPIVMDAMQNNVFPAVFFFGGWSLVSSIIILMYCRKVNLL